MHWILSNAQTWHAWKQTVHATVCGRIDVDHLRKFPARKISELMPQDEHKVCASCMRETGAAMTTLAPSISEWVALIKRYQAHIHSRIHERLIVLLAQRLAEVGPPSSPEGRQVFDHMKAILLRPMRQTKRNARGAVTTYSTFPNLKAALELLPPDTKALLRISEAVRVWRNITGQDLTRQRFRSDAVIEAILSVPSPESYISVMHSRGHSAFALLWHPNTIARARKDTALRGLFAGSTEYWTATTDQLNIVTE